MGVLQAAKIAVFVSGGGTNLQALIDAEKQGIIKSGKLSLVISNNANAYAITRAELAGIPSAIVTKKEYGTQQAFENKIIEILLGILAHLPQIVDASCLAGTHAGTLQCRQQDCRQNCNNGNDHEQLYKSEAVQLHSAAAE